MLSLVTKAEMHPGVFENSTGCLNIPTDVPILNSGGIRRIEKEQKKRKKKTGVGKAAKQ